MRRLRPTMFVSLALLNASCSLLIDQEINCSSDSDCAEGAGCRNGYCVLKEVPPDAAMSGPDASEPGLDASLPGQDAGRPDGGAAGLDAGAPGEDAGNVPDAGPTCPATVDCALAECEDATCAPGAQCSAGKCVKTGTSCEVDALGRADCDHASCAGAACGSGSGECTADLRCEHSLRDGCFIHAVSGIATCGAAVCKGASCGADQVCTASSCVQCGSPCGTAQPGCTMTIDCASGDCVETCRCRPDETYCQAADVCANLESDAAHCGLCGRSCSDGTCTDGCCGEPADCEQAATAGCAGSGYECVDDGGLRAKETACADGQDNDGDGDEDCADPDCDGLGCTGGGTCADRVCCDTPCAGGCDVCTAAAGATADGTCTVLTKGAAGGCGPAYVCAGGADCPAGCSDHDVCADEHYCDGTGCVASKSDGAECDAGAECSSGNCSDDRCCDKPCADPCDACSETAGASADGVCTLLPNTAEPVACAGYRCDGANATCPASCSVLEHCFAGYECQAPACKKSIGTICAEGTECASGNCADGVCCDAPCGGGCDVCSKAAGASVDGECSNLDDGATGSGCGAYLCAGTADCPTGGCVGDVDCVSGHTCDTVNGVCQ